MANIKVYSGFGFDIRDTDFSEILTAVSYTSNATSFIANYAMGREEFFGTGFVYDRMGGPTGGTVSSFSTWYQATQAFLVSGINVCPSPEFLRRPIQPPPPTILTSSPSP